MTSLTLKDYKDLIFYKKLAISTNNVSKQLKTLLDYEVLNTSISKLNLLIPLPLNLIGYQFSHNPQFNESSNLEINPSWVRTNDLWSISYRSFLHNPVDVEDLMTQICYQETPLDSIPLSFYKSRQLSYYVEDVFHHLVTLNLNKHLASKDNNGSLNSFLHSLIYSFTSPKAINRDAYFCLLTFPSMDKLEQRGFTIREDLKKVMRIIESMPIGGRRVKEIRKCPTGKTKTTFSASCRKVSLSYHFPVQSEAIIRLERVLGGNKDILPLLILKKKSFECLQLNESDIILNKLSSLEKPKATLTSIKKNLFNTKGDHLNKRLLTNILSSGKKEKTPPLIIGSFIYITLWSLLKESWDTLDKIDKEVKHKTPFFSLNSNFKTLKGLGTSIEVTDYHNIIQNNCSRLNSNSSFAGGLSKHFSKTKINTIVTKVNKKGIYSLVPKDDKTQTKLNSYKSEYDKRKYLQQYKDIFKKVGNQSLSWDKKRHLDPVFESLYLIRTHSCRWGSSPTHQIPEITTQSLNTILFEIGLKYFKHSPLNSNLRVIKQ